MRAFSFVEDVALPLDGSLMYGFENRNDEFFAQAYVFSCGDMVGKDFFPSIHLHDRDIILSCRRQFAH